MSDPDRPKLSLGIEAELESELEELDKVVWDELRRFLMPNNFTEDMVRQLVAAGSRRPPKQKAQFSVIIHAFARQAFHLEANRYPRYPPDDNFSNWLLKLAARVEDHVITVVQDIEASAPQKSFAYHGVTEDMMRDVIGQSLCVQMERFGLDVVVAAAPPPLPPKVQEQMQADVAGARSDIKPDETEVERRASLLSAYKLATGAKEYHIYTAQNSGIHKPQFYQWRDGRLPAKSKIAKRFENFLKAKRKPIRKISTY